MHYLEVISHNILRSMWIVSSQDASKLFFQFLWRLMLIFINTYQFEKKNNLVYCTVLISSTSCLRSWDIYAKYQIFETWSQESLNHIFSVHLHIPSYHYVIIHARGIHDAIMKPAMTYIVHIVLKMTLRWKLCVFHILHRNILESSI